MFAQQQQHVHAQIVAQQQQQLIQQQQQQAVPAVQPPPDTTLANEHRRRQREIAAAAKRIRIQQLDERVRYFIRQLASTSSAAAAASSSSEEQQKPMYLRNATAREELDFILAMRGDFTTPRHGGPTDACHSDIIPMPQPHCTEWLTSVARALDAVHCVASIVPPPQQGVTFNDSARYNIRRAAELYTRALREKQGIMYTSVASELENRIPLAFIQQITQAFAAVGSGSGAGDCGAAATIGDNFQAAHICIEMVAIASSSGGSSSSSSGSSDDMLVCDLANLTIPYRCGDISHILTDMRQILVIYKRDAATWNQIASTPPFPHYRYHRKI